MDGLSLSQLKFPPTYNFLNYKNNNFYNFNKKTYSTNLLYICEFSFNLFFMELFQKDGFIPLYLCVLNSRARHLASFNDISGYLTIVKRNTLLVYPI